jgi:hypothetical protein
VFLSRDDILKTDDLKRETVNVPEWDGDVIVRALNGRERDDWEASIVQQRGKDMVRNLANVRAKLVVRSVIDEDGNRIFEDRDANALGLKSAAALNRLFEVASRLSGLSDEDVEELAGNSDAAQSGDSFSG